MTLPPANAAPTGVYMLTGDNPSRLIKLGEAHTGRCGRWLEHVAKMFQLYKYGNGTPDRHQEWPEAVRKTIYPTGFFTLAGGSVMVVPAVRTEADTEDDTVNRCVDVFLFTWGQGELVKDDTE